MMEIVNLPVRDETPQPDQKICQCGGQAFLIYGDGVISCISCSEEYSIDGWLDKAE